MNEIKKKDDYYSAIESVFELGDAFVTTPDGDVKVLNLDRFESSEQVIEIMSGFYKYVKEWTNGVPQRLQVLPYSDLEWVMGNGDDIPILHLNKKNEYVNVFCTYVYLNDVNNSINKF